MHRVRTSLSTTRPAEPERPAKPLGKLSAERRSHLVARVTREQQEATPAVAAFNSSI